MKIREITADRYSIQDRALCENSRCGNNDDDAEICSDCVEGQRAFHLRLVEAGHHGQNIKVVSRGDILELVFQ